MSKLVILAIAFLVVAAPVAIAYLMYLRDTPSPGNWEGVCPTCKKVLTNQLTTN